MKLDRLIKSTILSTAVLSFLVFSLAGSSLAVTAVWINGTVNPLYPDHLVTTDEVYEDLMLDGEGTYQDAEQQLDVRSTYMAVDGTDMWIRSYSESGNASASQVDYFWFIDTDNNPATGGPASAGTTLLPTFEPDPYYNGFEVAFVNIAPGSSKWYKWSGVAWIDQGSAIGGFTNGKSIDPYDSTNHYYAQIQWPLSEMGLQIGDEVRILPRTEKGGYGDYNGWSESSLPLGTWTTYLDFARLIEQNLFAGSATVYLKGTWFAPSTTYKVAYYDTTNSLSTTNTPASDASGVLLDSISSGTSDGIWHCVVFDIADMPDATYTPTNPLILAITYFKTDSTPPVAPVITSPLSGTTTDDATITLIGTGEASTAEVVIRIDVYQGATKIGETNTDTSPSGNWSFTTSPLPDGTYTFKARAYDGLYYSPDSNLVTVTIDTTPTITFPLTGTITNDATPAVGGTGPAGSRIDVYIDNAIEGQVYADGAGNWSFTSPVLSDGTHTFKAQSYGGLYFSGFSNSVVLNIDTTPPAVPIITSPGDGSAGNDDTPTIIGVVTGTASPGVTVTIYVDGNPVGTTPVDSSGNWSFTLPSQPDGFHVIEADASDELGNRSAKCDPITIAIGVNVYPFITNVTFNGKTIINNDYVASNTVLSAKITDEGVAGIDPASIVIIIDEGTANEKTLTGLAVYYNTVTNLLSFQFTGANALTEGTHTIKIDAANKAGNKASDAVPDRSVKYTVRVSLGDSQIISPPRPYPNPFNPGAGPTKITYNLNKDTAVKIMFFNVSANMVRIIGCPAGTEGGRAGYNEVEFDGRDFHNRILSSQAFLVYIFDAQNSKLLGKTKVAIYNQ